MYRVAHDLIYRIQLKRSFNERAPHNRDNLFSSQRLAFPHSSQDHRLGSPLLYVYLKLAVRDNTSYRPNLALALVDETQVIEVLF